MGKIIAFDIETNGLDPKVNDILSITVCVATSIEDIQDEIYEEHRFAVIPTEEMERSDGAQKLRDRLYGEDSYHSWKEIHDDLVKNFGYTSVTKHELAEKLAELFTSNYGETLPVIGQYVQFDIGFVRELLKQELNKLIYGVVELDTRTLYYMVKYKQFGIGVKAGGTLEKIIDDLQIPYIEDPNWHFSNYDCLMTLKVFNKLWPELSINTKYEDK